MLDDAAAVARLVSVGVPPDLAASMVERWSAQKSARRQNVFGLLLDRPAAQLLKEKVAATKEQVVKKLMPIQAAGLALASYGIPAEVANALLAAWDAQAYKQVDVP